MKLNHLNLLILIAVLFTTSFFTACNGSKEPSALAAQSERLNSELTALAQGSPELFASLTCSYSTPDLTVAAVMSDTIFSATDFNLYFAEYVVAQYLKSHVGSDLDIVLNTLGKEEGKMNLEITCADGSKTQFDFTSARLKKLVQLKNSEINYSDARLCVLDIMNKRCEAYRNELNAKSVEFEYINGFAQYTFVFDNQRAFANQTNSTMQGRFRRVLSEQYAAYGECKPFVMGLINSLGIDGYRYVFTDKDEKRTIKAPIVWKYIN